MKRFVDIRAALTGWRFAWWDTVTDKFESHAGQMAWDTFDEFAGFYSGPELERYRGLAPDWAFESVPSDDGLEEPELHPYDEMVQGKIDVGEPSFTSPRSTDHQTG